MRKTDERLAFEADRQRMRLEMRIVSRALLNVLEEELEEIHHQHNERGQIARVSLETADITKLTDAAKELLGDVTAALPAGS